MEERKTFRAVYSARLRHLKWLILSDVILHRNFVSILNLCASSYKSTYHLNLCGHYSTHYLIMFKFCQINLNYKFNTWSGSFCFFDPIRELWKFELLKVLGQIIYKVGSPNKGTQNKGIFPFPNFENSLIWQEISRKKL